MTWFGGKVILKMIWFKIWSQYLIPNQDLQFGKKVIDPQSWSDLRSWSDLFRSDVTILWWYVVQYHSRRYLGILSRKFLLRQHDNGKRIVVTMTTIMTMKNPDKIKQKSRQLMLKSYLINICKLVMEQPIFRMFLKHK